eukprot:COSAG02_NODE_1836_length_10713_cov_5.352271_11_plen_152_part_00
MAIPLYNCMWHGLQRWIHAFDHRVLTATRRAVPNASSNAATHFEPLPTNLCPLSLTQAGGELLYGDWVGGGRRAVQNRPRQDSTTRRLATRLTSSRRCMGDCVTRCRLHLPCIKRNVADVALLRSAEAVLVGPTPTGIPLVYTTMGATGVA